MLAKTPKTSELQASGIARLASAILETAVLEWKLILENELPYDVVKYSKGKIGEEEKELIECFNSNWFQLLWDATVPNISYNRVLAELKVPKLRKLDDV